LKPERVSESRCIVGVDLGGEGEERREGEEEREKEWGDRVERRTDRARIEGGKTKEGGTEDERWEMENGE